MEQEPVGDPQSRLLAVRAVSEQRPPGAVDRHLRGGRDHLSRDHRRSAARSDRARGRRRTRRAAGARRRMPAEAEGVLLKAMAVDQKARFQTAAEFQQALLRVTPDLRRPPAVIETIEDDRRAERDGGGLRAAKDRIRSADRLPFRSPRHFGRRCGPRSIASNRPARAIDDTVRRTTGLSLASDTHAAARPAGLWWASPPACWVYGAAFRCSASSPPPASMTAGASGALMTLRIAAGLLLTAAMAIGGAAGLAGDARGGAVLWSAIWCW